MLWKLRKQQKQSFVGHPVLLIWLVLLLISQFLVLLTATIATIFTIVKDVTNATFDIATNSEGKLWFDGGKSDGKGFSSKIQYLLK